MTNEEYCQVKEAERKANLSKLKKTLLKYYGWSVLLTFFLIFTHYPNFHSEGTSLELLHKMFVKQWWSAIVLFIGQQFLYAFLIMPFLILFKVRWVGWIPAAVLAFFIGLEKYIFYIQGQATPWNIGFNEDMLINFLANPTGLADTLDSYGKNPVFWYYHILVPLMYFSVFWFVSRRLPDFEIPGKKWIYIASLAMTIFGSSFAYDTPHTPYYLRIQRTVSDHLWDKFVNYFGGKREQPYFLYHGEGNQTKKRPQNIVYIIDESVRGDLISLNNTKDPLVLKTTPWLNKNRDKLINFGNNYSWTNCSYPSNSAFIIGMDHQKDLVTPMYMIKAPTIFQYMKNAGYETYYVDNVHNGLYFIFHTDDRKYLDHIINDYDEWRKKPKWSRDIATLDQVKKILHNGKKNFIVILKYGIHFPFKNAINPKDEPLGHIDPNSLKHEDYYKLYLNALKQSVDNYWKHLVEDTTKGTDTVVLWASDHSVNIVPNQGDDYIRMTHCENGMTSYQEMYSIPGALYSPNPKYYKGFKKEYKHGYWTKHMFSTLLDFAGYTPEQYTPYYGPSWKNPSPRVELWNPTGVYIMDSTGENTSIYGHADFGVMNSIDPLNKRRIFKNTLPNRELSRRKPETAE